MAHTKQIAQDRRSCKVVKEPHRDTSDFDREPQPRCRSQHTGNTNGTPILPSIGIYLNPSLTVAAEPPTMEVLNMTMACSPMHIA